MYQQTRLSDTSAIGVPGPLPDVIASWGDAPDILADLTGHVDPQFGLDGTGFWPVVVATPGFDATRRSLAGTVTLGAVDPTARTWAATADLRDLTAAEVAALAPPSPPVSGDAILGAIGKADRAKADPFDVARIAWRDDVPATNAKLGRIARAIGTTPDALRAAAAG